MAIPSTVINALIPKAWQKRLASLFIGGLLSLNLWGCANGGQNVRLVELPDIPTGTEVRRLSGAVSEVAPPAVLLDLRALSDRYQPQVTIAAPKANQVIDTNKIEVKLKLKGLSIYKDDSLKLGPHLQVILDHQPARSVYSLKDSITFNDLTPGSHTIQVVAVNPWGESFKNEAAYTQTTFHVFAKTGENTPNPDQPLLTYLEPQGTYGAEPVLLDFYLNNAPLHQIAQESDSDDIVDWQIRCTVNGQSFVVDQWQPIYLKGLTPGQNWIQLTLIDREGNPIENAFNSTIRTLTYKPNQRDSLSKIIRGELPLEKVGQIVDASYEPPVVVIETPSVIETSQTAIESSPGSAEQDAAAKKATTENAANNATHNAVSTSESPIEEPQDQEKQPLRKLDVEPSQQEESIDNKIEVNGFEENENAETDRPIEPASSSPASKEENAERGGIFKTFNRFFGAPRKDRAEEAILETPGEQPESKSPNSSAVDKSTVDKSTVSKSTVDESTSDQPSQEKLSQEKQKVEADTEKAADKTADLIEQLPLKETSDADTSDFNASDSLNTSDSAEAITTKAITTEPLTSEPLDSEPLTSEPLDSEPLGSEPLDSEEIQSSSIDEGTLPSIEGLEIGPPSEDNDSFFSRWSDKVTTFFKQPTSSNASAKPSNQISIEELPVIVEEPAETDSPMESTAPQDVLDKSESDLPQPEIEEENIDSDALNKTETEVEEAPLETFIVPDTLSAPGLPSDNVIAPLTQ